MSGVGSGNPFIIGEQLVLLLSQKRVFILLNALIEKEPLPNAMLENTHLYRYAITIIPPALNYTHQLSAFRLRFNKPLAATVQWKSASGGVYVVNMLNFEFEITDVDPF